MELIIISSDTIILMNNKSIPAPSAKEVKKYISTWKSLDNYVLQERSLEKLFLRTYPNNNDLDDVLIKVCSLNDFYSTNIFSPFTVAKHIVELNIDKDLKKENLSIVNKIGLVTMNGNKQKNFYSFATKYCSHHKPNVYPIYDSYVEKVLMHLKKKDSFSKFKKADLKEYELFKSILLDFQKFYNLEQFDIKHIDQYLWQLGKEYFPKNYNRK